jgi:hypothetical protein
MLDLTLSVRRYAPALAALLLFSVATGASAENRYTVSPDGQEVVDNTTHLIWRRCAEGAKWIGKGCVGQPTKLSLSDAKAWAATEASSSGKAWHVPDEAELVALVDKSKKKPKIDEIAFPTTPAVPFWCLRPGYTDNLNAYLVSFGNGRVTAALGERKTVLRLVRSSN